MISVDVSTTYIYCLIDPNGEVKYVGKSDEQIDLEGVVLNTWPSIIDAVESTHINRTSINYVLKNKRKTAGGFKWKYCNIY